MVTYTYDAWGNVTTSGTQSTGIGAKNPVRYRGYYYDSETGLYYVSSRYYDPEMGRWINADSVVAGIGENLLGYNMFAYCFNNPVNMMDNSGHWPQWIKDAVDWVNDNIIQPVSKVIKNVNEDIKAYDTKNESEKKVFSSHYFSNYKGSLVIKTPFDASFSFGVIGLSKSQQNSDTLKHEYGHTVQLKNKGVVDYTMDVAIPSVTIKILRRNDKLPYSYYGAPWEAEADMFGGVNRTFDNTPWPEGTYNSYWDLIKMFWE